MAKSRFTPEQIRSIVQQAQDGASVTTLCCDNRISASTFYQWRQKHGKLPNPPATATGTPAAAGSAPPTTDAAKTPASSA